METETVALLLRDLGGYGMAALMWWFWRQERAERLKAQKELKRLLYAEAEQTPPSD